MVNTWQEIAKIRLDPFPGLFHHVAMNHGVPSPSGNSVIPVKRDRLLLIPSRAQN
jgi:hypothetical protein